MAAHVAAYSKKFQCQTCPWGKNERGRHCDATNPAPFKQWAIPGVIESDTCLLPMITRNSHSYLRLHRHYDNRILPQAGGLCDQPHLYIQAMEVLDRAFNEIEAERMKGDD